MANEQNHAPLTAWAISSGLTARNVLNNGRSDAAVHVSADIAFAIGEEKLDDSHLVSMLGEVEKGWGSIPSASSWMFRGVHMQCHSNSSPDEQTSWVIN